MARCIAAALVFGVWAGSWIAPTVARGDDLLGAKAVQEMRALIAAHEYRKLRQRLAALEPMLAERSAALCAEFAALQKDFSRARDRWLTECVTKWLFDELEGCIRRKVANVKLGARKTVAWARERLEKEALGAIAKRMEPFDDVSEKEIRAAWSRRERGDWRRIPIPRGMTRDDIRADEDWWRKAPLAERRERLLLVFVAGGDLVQVRGEPFWSPCATCEGTGLQTRRLASGETLSYLCKTCEGAQRSAVLGFR